LAEEARRAGRCVQCLRLSIPDNDIPSPTFMRTILDAIDQANAAGRVVYVHCWAGKGRTGTVVGCWLARHGLAVGDDALWRLNELVGHRVTSFGGQPQTQSQRYFVRTWKPGQ
jgi:protein-tyrosine phosphatase